MKCENCPLLIVENCGEATMYPDEYCGFEGEYEPTKDDEGCRIPWSKVQKLLKLRGDV